MPIKGIKVHLCERDDVLLFVVVIAEHLSRKACCCEIPSIKGPLDATVPTE